MLGHLRGEILTSGIYFPWRHSEHLDEPQNRYQQPAGWHSLRLGVALDENLVVQKLCDRSVSISETMSIHLKSHKYL